MPESFLVEIWGEPAGIVLREESGFRFHAVTQPFFELDGRQYGTPGQAKLAAATVAKKRQMNVHSRGLYRPENGTVCALSISSSGNAVAALSPKAARHLAGDTP